MLIRLGLIVLTSALATGCGHLAQRVEHGIESAGSEVVGVPVRVEHVHLGLFRGLGDLSGVTVANPDGYRTDYAFRMDQARLNIRILSLLGGNPIVLDEVIIDSPVLTFEPNPEGGSNLKDIADHVQSTQASAEPKPEPAEAESAATPSEPLRIAIRYLVIKGVTFELQRPDGSFLSGTLPALERTDVGGHEGDTPGQIGTAIVLSMTRQMFIQLAATTLAEFADVLSTLDVAHLLEEWGGILSVSDEQLAELRPILEEHVARMRDAFEQMRAQGFLDLDLLSEQINIAAGYAQAQLSEVLTPEQLNELTSLFDTLRRRSVEEILDSLAEGLSASLGLRPEQMERLRPILRNHIRKRMELLGRFLHESEWTLDTFMQAYEALQQDLRHAVSEVLDPAQMVELAHRQQQLLEMIRVAGLGLVEP